MTSTRLSALSAIAFMLASVSLASCNNPTTPPPQPPEVQPSATQTSTNLQSPAAQTSAKTDKQRDVNALADLEPEVGVIRAIQQGDLMCYITFKDETGAERTVGATFELCENPQQFINQRVRLVYGVETVNDCQGIEPCGKTRRAQLVVQMHRVDAAGRPVDSDVQVLSNGEWTITVGNRDSWSGVNGTGDLTYRGCNAKQECLDLTAGKITCRNGMCSTTWVNGDYSYTLVSPITDGTAPSESKLVVSRNGNVLQEITGLK